MKDITVLFVDDEKNLLDALARRLNKESYKKIFKDNAVSALESLAEEPIQVVVTDILMPGMDGLTLLKKIKEAYPNTVRIVLSGQEHLSRVVAAINSGEVFRYCVKPIGNTNDDLIRIIHEAIDYHLLRREREDLVFQLRQKNQELETSLARVKHLEGLLPICAICKKIRNDDRYWVQVEKYIEEHSSAKFTHSYCPDCYKKLLSSVP